MAGGREARSETKLLLREGYEDTTQQAGQVPGLADDHWDFGVVQAALTQELEEQSWRYTMALISNGGEAGQDQGHFADVTAKPEVRFEVGRQVHHIALTGTLSYDSTGLDRRPLSEQWDNLALTPEEKKRYRYLSIGTDHYLQLGPRSSVVVYLFASYLDRELKSKVFSLGGYYEYETSPRWRVRLGGTDQKYEYGSFTIADSGPELSAVYLARPGVELEGKIGAITVTDDNGTGQTTSEYLALRVDRDTLAFRASWQRGLNARSAIAALTTSDVYMASLKAQLNTRSGVELLAEQRHEDWVKGYDDGTPADSMSGELRYIYHLGPELKDQPAQSAFAVSAGLAFEQLQVKTGQTAQRQVLRLGVEQRL